MNFRRKGRRGIVETVIDVTSLIDAAFILIIFLLISTTFKKKEHAFSITLPTAAQEELVVQTGTHSVYVTREGSMFLLQMNGEEAGDRRGEPVTAEELRGKLEELARRQPDLSISILAQEDTDYQKVIDVLSEVSKAGIQNVQLPYEYATPKSPE